MRLIDADAVREEIDRTRPGRNYEDAWTLTVLDNAHTIDAVPVVRCCDCVHKPSDPENVGHEFELVFPDEECPCWCDDGFYSYMPKDDWFCANGKRKDKT